MASHSLRAILQEFAASLDLQNMTVLHRMWAYTYTLGKRLLRCLP